MKMLRVGGPPAVLVAMIGSALVGTFLGVLPSSARAEATRQALVQTGVAATRFARIEGVADREPYIPGDKFDPGNRRMIITLAWSRR